MENIFFESEQELDYIIGKYKAKKELEINMDYIYMDSKDIYDCFLKQLLDFYNFVLNLNNEEVNIFISYKIKIFFKQLKLIDNIIFNNNKINYLDKLNIIYYSSFCLGDSSIVVDTKSHKTNINVYEYYYDNKSNSYCIFIFNRNDKFEYNKVILKNCFWIE